MFVLARMNSPMFSGVGSWVFGFIMFCTIVRSAGLVVLPTSWVWVWFRIFGLSAAGWFVMRMVAMPFLGVVASNSVCAGRVSASSMMSSIGGVVFSALAFAIACSMLM